MAPSQVVLLPTPSALTIEYDRNIAAVNEFSCSFVCDSVYANKTAEVPSTSAVLILSTALPSTSVHSAVISEVSN